MAAHTDPEDALTYDPPPTVVKAPVEAPKDEPEADDDTDDPKKPRLNKGAKKK
jgi:hypothetical protein